MREYSDARNTVHSMTNSIPLNTIRIFTVSDRDPFLIMFFSKFTYFFYLSPLGRIQIESMDAEKIPFQLKS
jgi:hypothetical protein